MILEMLEKIHYELAALIPNPSNPKEEDWPCDNPADRECLQIAYETLLPAKDRLKNDHNN